jgi:hypothetical protein
MEEKVSAGQRLGKARMTLLLGWLQATAAETTKVSITGTAKALGDSNAKMDPSVAYATVTTEDRTVYYVYGWAGVIVAKSSGKKVEVTGAVGVVPGSGDHNGLAAGAQVNRPTSVLRHRTRCREAPVRGPQPRRQAGV